jgi:hypothetical protein
MDAHQEHLLPAKDAAAEVEIIPGVALLVRECVNGVWHYLHLYRDLEAMDWLRRLGSMPRLPWLPPTPTIIDMGDGVAMVSNRGWDTRFEATLAGFCEWQFGMLMRSGEWDPSRN